MYNNHHFNVKMASEFFEGENLIIHNTFPDKPGEGSMQVIDFIIWPQMGC
jgi:hypothetical protein